LTSRSDLDRPATVIAAVVGLVVILVALPFTIAAFPQTPKSYDVAWGERPVASASLTVPTDSNTWTLDLPVANFQPASVKVETPVCTDTFNPQLQQQPATLHVRLTEKRGSTTSVLKDIPDVRCADKDADGKGTFTVHLGGHFDVATTQANDAATAKKIAWLDASAMNVTGSTYTLEVTPSRSAGTLPALPVAPTSLAASLRLTVNGWDAALNEHQKEVGR
jgi:hypothetical protein